MEIKQFIMQIPYLCHADDATRYSKINELVFDYELANKDSPFKRNRNDIDDPENRMRPMFAFPGGEVGRIMQCKRLLRIAELSHYKNEHNDRGVSEELDALIVEAVDNEQDYPDIAAVMTVDKAASAAAWNA